MTYFKIIIGAFFINALLDGILNSIGLLFTSMLDFFSTSVTLTSIVPALVNSCLYLYSPITYSIVKLLGNRKSAIFGGCILSFSLVTCYFMYSIVSVQIILGAIFTFGMSLASSAAFIALQTDFNIRRCNGRLLSALAFSGGGIGEMTFPLLCQYFLDKYNWQDSSLLLGGLVLNVVAFGILLNGRTLSTAVIPMKMLSGGKIAIGNLAKSELSAKQYSTCDDSNSSRQQLQRSSTSASTDQHQHRQDTVKSDEQKHFENTTISFCRSNFKRCKNWIRSIIDFNVLKHSHFWLFSLSSSVSVMAQNAPLIFLADHITSEKIPLRSEIAYSVIGAQSIVSELIAGFIIDRRILNNWIIYVLWTLLSGLSCVLLFFKTVMCIILFCVLYGFGISFNYVITIALMSEIFSEDSRYTAYGFLEMTQGLAMLIGIPLSGMLRDKFGSYQSSFVFTFICKVIASFIMMFWTTSR